MEEIGNWDYPRLARFSPRSFQEKNGLCAELAANPAIYEAQEKCMDQHEPFDKGIFHCYFVLANMLYSMNSTGAARLGYKMLVKRFTSYVSSLSEARNPEGCHRIAG